jgi:hypothetical protein
VYFLKKKKKNKKIKKTTKLYIYYGMNMKYIYTHYWANEGMPGMGSSPFLFIRVDLLFHFFFFLGDFTLIKQDTGSSQFPLKWRGFFND